jgi:hypothetical protein
MFHQMKKYGKAVKHLTLSSMKKRNIRNNVQALFSILEKGAFFIVKV